MPEKAQAEKLIPRINMELCVACTMCVDICPAGALDIMIKNSITGFRRYPVLPDPKICTGCLSCESDCPAGAISMMSADAC